MRRRRTTYVLLFLEFEEEVVEGVDAAHRLRQVLPRAHPRLQLLPGRHCADDHRYHNVVCETSLSTYLIK